MGGHGRGAWDKTGIEADVFGTPELLAERSREGRTPRFSRKRVVTQELK